MVEAGTVEIGGELDTSDIERGQTRVRQGFNQLEGQVASSSASFSRLGDAASSVSSTLTTIGTAGVSSMAGLASMSPAVAGSLAEIKSTTVTLSNTLGQSLQPAFEFASESLSKFTNYIQQNQGPINDFTENAVKGMKNAIEGASTAWSGLVDATDTIDKNVNMNLGGELGELIAPAVAAKFLGKTPIGKGAVFAGTQFAQETGEQGGLLQGAASFFGGTGISETTGRIAGGAAAGGALGGLPGAAIGGAAGLLPQYYQYTLIDPMTELLGMMGMREEDNQKKNVAMNTTD